jgi:hypothetical protein
VGESIIEYIDYAKIVKRKTKKIEEFPVLLCEFPWKNRGEPLRTVTFAAPLLTFG